MPERHGIERLRWLEEDEPDVGYPTPSGPDFRLPRHMTHGPAATQIEVAYALIEELHDAMNSYHAKRQGIVFDPTTPLESPP